MNNEEKMLEMLARMESDMTGMKADIAQINEIQAEHTAVLAEHTAALNALIEWAHVRREADRFPLPKLM